MVWIQVHTYHIIYDLSFDPGDPTRATQRTNDLKCRTDVSTV